MSAIKRISTPHSYSTAVVAGEYVFIGLHRGFGENFETQLESTFESLKSTLAELGMPLASIVKVNVWLKDINDLSKMEKMFNKYFDDGGFPVRMTSTTEFFDDDCLVMIDGVAYKKA